MSETDKTDDILRKIRNLLRLAGNNTNEHEAAAAAAKASRLLAEHNLTLSQVEDKSEKRVEESTPSTMHKEKWVLHIWSAVSDLNFCKYTYTTTTRGIRHDVVGTYANTQSTQVMAEYLVDTVHRLCNEARNEQRIKGTEANGFKLGASHRLWARLKELKKQRAAGTEQPVAGVSNLPALANLYDVHALANDEFFKAKYPNVKFGKGSAISTKSSSAYQQGRRAADSISLNRQVDRSTSSGGYLK